MTQIRDDVFGIYVGKYQCGYTFTQQASQKRQKSPECISIRRYRMLGYAPLVDEVGSKE
jgi:hypothetical protein